MRLAKLSVVSGLLALSVAGGCAGGMRTADGTRDDRSLITREQILGRHFSTAYDAVHSIRGNWLIARGKESLNRTVEIQVYVDGVRMGGLATLQGIATETVQYIRYYSGIEATTRWGLGHGRGAIFVVTEGSLPGAFVPPDGIKPPVAMRRDAPGAASASVDHGF
jgi:hypothetical protein